MSANIKKASNLIAKVEISKNLFFGKKVFVVFYITPSLRLISFEKNSDSNFPFEKNKIIDISTLEMWVIKNQYSISFFTNNSYLKRELIYHFDKPVFDNKVSKKKSDLYNQKFFKSFENIYNKCEK
jgi:hypothetical protein